MTGGDTNHYTNADLLIDLLVVFSLNHEEIDGIKTFCFWRIRITQNLIEIDLSNHASSISIILKLTDSFSVPSFSVVKTITLLPGRQNPCSFATFKIKLIRRS